MSEFPLEVVFLQAHPLGLALLVMCRGILMTQLVLPGAC